MFPLPPLFTSQETLRAFVNWHAHCNHVGVNVVCIDAVYKCCTKKKEILVAQRHKHLR